MKPRVYWHRKYGWLPHARNHSDEWWKVLRFCSALDRLNPATPET
ncbi:hypothetical protein RCIP0075_00052 [Klebsiella phage RCIP0075]